MHKSEIKRQQLLDAIADYLLINGLQDSSLRHLAAAIGTSDRMLLHYFVNKEELMTASLNLIAARMLSLLESARAQPMRLQTLLAYLTEIVKEPRFRPYLRLWLELVALSTSMDVYRLIARQICNSFYNWITLALEVGQEEDREPLAAFIFATVEGFVLLDALECGTLITSGLQGAMRSTTSSAGV